MSALVDVALQVFGKPYQTALCLLSLQRHCGQWLRNVFYIMEDARPKFDNISVACLQDIVPGMHSIQLTKFFGVESAEISKIKDASYRRSIRYQYAWEQCSADYLLIIHNDVIILGDVIEPMLERLEDNIAVGSLGQCWNCPACRQHIVGPLKINNGIPCQRGNYKDFHLTFEELDAMYRLARRRKEHCRDYLKVPWAQEFRHNPWPLPECRINEWCCLINMRKARDLTMPLGKARPFGLYASQADLGVAWFRDVHHMGERAQHLDITSHARHTLGHPDLWHPDTYRAKEMEAAAILRRDYTESLSRLATCGLAV